jgi:hypothetical protein
MRSPSITARIRKVGAASGFGDIGGAPMGSWSAFIGHISLCATAAARFSHPQASCETADAISGNSAVAFDDLGRETPRLKLTTPKFAETFGKMSTLRTTYSAAMGARRFTIAR